jgi:hypothetical protein
LERLILRVGEIRLIFFIPKCWVSKVLGPTLYHAKALKSSFAFPSDALSPIVRALPHPCQGGRSCEGARSAGATNAKELRSGAPSAWGWSYKRSYDLPSAAERSWKLLTKSINRAIYLYLYFPFYYTTLSHFCQ